MPRFLRKSIDRLQRFQRRTFRKIQKFFEALLAPFERAGRRVTKSVVAGADRVDRIGDLFSSVLRLLAWPFRALWSVVLKIYALVLPASVRSSISKRWRGVRRIAENAGKSLLKLALFLNLDRVVLPLVRVTRPIWRPIWLSIVSISGFLAAWSSTRRYKRLLWAMPAIVLLLPIGVVAARGYANRGSTVRYYHTARREAQEAQDYRLVQFFDRKLAQLGADNERKEYRFALDLAEDGQLEQAYARMQALAPPDEPGMAEAHIWILQQLLYDEIDASEDERTQLIGGHLDQLDALEVDAPALLYYRALWHQRQDQIAEAAEVLTPAVDELLEAATLRMYLNRQLQRTDEAAVDAAAVRRHMELRLRRNEPLRPYDYQAWRVAEELLGADDRVQAVLEHWVAAYPDEAEPREMLAEVRRQQYERTVRGGGRPRPERLVNLLTDAANTSADPRKMLPHVALLFRQREVNPLAASVVEQMLSSDETPSSFLEAMGTLAAVGGDWELGRELIGRALQKDPQNDVAWNNWAWVMLNQPEPDLEEAQKAVNRALELKPDDYLYRETRGQLMLKLGQWQRAIDDLEYAANGLPDYRELHESLAAAYEAIGNAELAEVHRQHAQ